MRYSTSKLGIFSEEKKLQTKCQYRCIARIIMNQYFKTNIKALFSNSKESESTSNHSYKSEINVPEVLKVNIAFCVLETQKRD